MYHYYLAQARTIPRTLDNYRHTYSDIQTLDNRTTEQVRRSSMFSVRSLEVH